jgi:hypothetical protein
VGGTYNQKYVTYVGVEVGRGVDVGGGVEAGGAELGVPLGGGLLECTSLGLPKCPSSSLGVPDGGGGGGPVPKSGR